LNVAKCLGLYLYYILWTNACNSVDDIIFMGLTGVPVVDKVLGRTYR